MVAFVHQRANSLASAKQKFAEKSLDLQKNAARFFYDDHFQCNQSGFISG